MHADHTALHAVMMVFEQHGVLITGEAGIGKSSLALAALEHGGSLVADDCVEVRRTEDGLVAHAPSNGFGWLHTRELGLIPVSELWGSQALRSESPLSVWVQLERQPPTADMRFAAWTERSLLGQNLPYLVLSVEQPASVLDRLKIALRLRSLQAQALVRFDRQIDASMHML